MCQPQRYWRVFTVNTHINIWRLPFVFHDIAGAGRPKTLFKQADQGKASKSRSRSLQPSCSKHASIQTNVTLHSRLPTSSQSQTCKLRVCNKTDKVFEFHRC